LRTKQSEENKPPMRISNSDVAAALGYSMGNESGMLEVMRMIRQGLRENRPIHFSTFQNPALMCMGILAGAANRDYHRWRKEDVSKSTQYVQGSE